MIKIASRGQKTSEKHVEAFLCNHSHVYVPSLVQLIVFTPSFLPPPAQYVHKQLKGAKERAPKHSIRRHHPLLSYCYRVMDVFPYPQGIVPRLLHNPPTSSSASVHPATHPPISSPPPCLCSLIQRVKAPPE